MLVRMNRLLEAWIGTNINHIGREYHHLRYSVKIITCRIGLAIDKV